ncbi:hypothetical protein CYMTET_15671 [Cymbomonas tetramitiformis]|uniref:Uncharacterized protein n=1 Tax=Cymbomonas tetramitiformis TaxID=36881 RepID=A0AAE0L8P4_9CHLO|nr:hypothetical protein CYMTET_15671 [Cymbomonas tetramitiformis]
MTGLNAVEVPRTEKIEQGADLEHGPDKLRGRQLLRFFADYGWYVGLVMGCRSCSAVGNLFAVCYTNGDKEELTWRQLCPKLLPNAPDSEEEAGIGEWAHAVTAAAQASPSSALEGDMEPQAAGGSVNNAGARVVEPPVCRFEVDGCTKTAQGSTEYCKAHRRQARQVAGCTKSAHGAVAHGRQALPI